MKQVELICINGDGNNNKFYKMTEQNNGTWLAEWGRVGYTGQTQIYPMNQWDKKYNEKTKKGYQDITSLRSDAVSSFSYDDVADKTVQKLLETLHKYAKQAISDNYTISSSNVTVKQIEEAQDIINDLATHLYKLTASEVNAKLTRLYTVIPRKMKHVKFHLVESLETKENQQFAKKLISSEQDLLDVMQQQVSMNVQPKTAGQTLEDALGIKITHVDDTEIQMIKEMMAKTNNENVFKKAYKIENIRTQKCFDEQKPKSYKPWTKLLWHGSRNENWLNIVKTGLLLRPSGVVTTGSMFGQGLYFADKCQKSLNYTSFKGSYWTNGKSNHAFLALYEVNTGMELRDDRHESWMYNLNDKLLKSKGEYDSFFAKGGYDLRNNEYIIYNQNQCTIKYLIEIEG